MFCVVSFLYFERQFGNECRIINKSVLLIKYFYAPNICDCLFGCLFFFHSFNKMENEVEVVSIRDFVDEALMLTFNHVWPPL